VILTPVTITALVTSPFTGAKNFTTSVVVQPVPVPPTKSFYQEIEPYLIYIVIVIVVVAAILIYLFFYRPWSRKKAATAATTEETQPYDELEEIPGAGEPGGEEGEEGQSPTAALGSRLVLAPFWSLFSLSHLGKVI
jgi:hypothetical protein